MLGNLPQAHAALNAFPAGRSSSIRCPAAAAGPPRSLRSSAPRVRPPPPRSRTVCIPAREQRRAKAYESKMDEAKDDVEEIDARAMRANVSVRRSEDEAKIPVPNRFHKTVVHYPGCVMFVTGLIAIVLGTERH